MCQLLHRMCGFKPKGGISRMSAQCIIQSCAEIQLMCDVGYGMVYFLWKFMWNSDVLRFFSLF